MSLSRTAALRRKGRYGTLPLSLPPLLALWALLLWPVRFAGVAWVAGLLALLVLACAYDVLRGGVYQTCLRLKLGQDSLTSAAVAIGVGGGFLLSALEAAGRVPASLEGSPGTASTLLYCSAASILVIRAFARQWLERQSFPASLDTPPDEERIPSQALLDVQVWFVPGGAAALCLLAALALGTTARGFTTVAQALMAILAAVSIDSVRLIRNARRDTTAAGETLIPRVDKVLFEKSVLTMGPPEVVAVFPMQNDLRPEDVLHHAAAAEYTIEHPIREAILRSYGEDFRTVPSIKAIQHIPSRGIRAIYRGKDLLLGNIRLFREAHWSDERLELLEKKQDELASEGETVVFLAIDGKLAGAICLEEQLCSSAATTLGELAARGIPSGILSGDTPQSVRKLVAPLGTVELHAGLVPAEEAELIHRERADDRRVAVVRKSARSAKTEAPTNTQWTLSLGGEDKPIPVRPQLSEILRIVSLGTSFRATQRRLSFCVGLYHVVTLCLVSGMFQRWTNLPPLPALAACLGALAPAALTFVFAPAGTYNRVE
jgi:hypothetical protein